MKEQPIIEITGLSFGYEREEVLTDINMTIHKGEFLGLVGPNGSGKSTLIKCILGLNQPNTGAVKLFGIDSKKFKEWYKIGYVSQKANSFNTGFPATVFEVVQSGLASKIGMFKRNSKENEQQILESLAAVEMQDFADKNIGELSGGQQQRVFIARALVSKPELLILDEPTVGVDQSRVQSFYNMLEYLNRTLGITLLLVTHDIGTITDKVSNVACINRSLHFHGPSAVFSSLKEEELSEYYGHHLHLITHNH